MFDGVPRNEKMMVQGNTLIIQNVNDGYTATFDYDKVSYIYFGSLRA